MVSSLSSFAIYLACIAAALAVSALLVSATGGSATSVLSAILDGSLRAPGRWGHTLLRAAPLLAVAIGTIISSRAGLTNIGQEGQVLIGAAATSYVATRLGGPGGLVLVVATAVGIIGGALWAGIAAGLRYTRKVPEVITTLLLIFVAANLVTYALTQPWLLRGGEAVGRINSGDQLTPDTRLQNFELFGNELDTSVLIALVVAGATAVMLGRTVWGFRLHMLGRSPRAAQRNGVSAAWVGSAALMVSGGLAGLAGSMMLTGGVSDNRMTLGFSNNVGWEGLLVALLARSNPIAAIPMAVVFAALRTGSGFLAATGVDRQIADVVQALLVLALLLPPAIQFVRERRRLLAATRSVV
ncbi:MAG: ABC transporter permease [Actinomycetota bacterium]|nr:ABC transporter permease [Actinomycetota bacterium]